MVELGPWKFPARTPVSPFVSCLNSPGGVSPRWAVNLGLSALESGEWGPLEVAHSPLVTSLRAVLTVWVEPLATASA